MTTSHSDPPAPADGGGRSTPEQGWFVAADGQQHGPVSAGQAWRLVMGIVSRAAVHVWHPSLPAWQTLSGGATPSPAPDLAKPAKREKVSPLTDEETAGLQLEDFRLSNALLIACLACAIAPVFILGAAVVRDIQDAFLTLSFLALIGYLGWWLYIEQCGVRMQFGELVVPARLGIWPYPAWRRKLIKVSDITGFECWAQGQFLHWFRLHFGRTSSTVLLDNPLHREVLRLALERTLPKPVAEPPGT